MATVRRTHRGTGGRLHRGGPHQAEQGRGVSVQLSRVSRDLRRGLQGWLRSGQHQLPLRPRGSHVPLRQCRCRSRRVPRDVRAARRRRARAAPESTSLVLRGRRIARRAVVGGRLRPRGGPLGAGPGARAVGTQSRRSLAPVHRWNHRDAQGCDVASGRSLQRAGRGRSGAPRDFAC